MFPTECGVYKITCPTTGAFYIGSSANIHRRLLKHFWELKRGIHSNPYLQNAWNKYGDFEASVVELCSREVQLEREQFYLDTTSCNWTKGGFNFHTDTRGRTNIKLTSEQRQKISDGLKQYRKRCPMTEEHRRNISENRKGKSNCPEAIEKMRVSKTGSKQSEECVDKRAKDFAFVAPDGTVHRGRNLKRFAEAHGLHRFNLNMLLAGKRKTHHGWTALIEK